MTSNVLMAVPILAVTGGLAAPFLLLDAKKAYVEFLWSNPNLVTAGVAAWGILFYWLTRRGASRVLLRGSGAKLRVGDDPA
jgi:hypothetical protein